MARKSTLEWESQKSKSLTEVLARDNGNFLYRELPRIIRNYCKEDQIEDLAQDFFIDLTGRAHSYRYDIDISKCIHEDPNLKAWVINSYVRFRIKYYRKEERRIQKEKRKPRAQELNLDRIMAGRFSLINPRIYQSEDDWYKVCMEGSETPEQGIFEMENTAEIERKKQEIAEAIQNAMSQLNPNRRRVIQLYYFDGLSTKEIGRTLGVSQSNVTSQLFFARKDLINVLPYSVMDKRGWVEEAA